MILREATLNDIQQIQLVRNSVRENKLSSPGFITDEECEDFLTRRGKGWVCEIDNTIVGFAIADLQENNIWALFLKPEFEGKGFGQQLHDTMLNWYFSHNKKMVWLGTAPDTRAEGFYRKSGWQEVGSHAKGEVKFVMFREDWKAK